MFTESKYRGVARQILHGLCEPIVCNMLVGEGRSINHIVEILNVLMLVWYRLTCGDLEFRLTCGDLEFRLEIYLTLREQVKLSLQPVEMQQRVTPSDQISFFHNRTCQETISSQQSFHIDVSEWASTYEVFSFFSFQLDIRQCWKKLSSFQKSIVLRREIVLWLGVAPNLMTSWNFVNPYLASFICMRLWCNRHLCPSLLALVINTLEVIQRSSVKVLERNRRGKLSNGGRSWSGFGVPEIIDVMEKFVEFQWNLARNSARNLKLKFSTRHERNLFFNCQVIEIERLPC